MDTFQVLMRIAMDYQREMRRNAEWYGRIGAACVSPRETLPVVLRRRVRPLRRLFAVAGRRLEEFRQPR